MSASMDTFLDPIIAGNVTFLSETKTGPLTPNLNLALPDVSDIDSLSALVSESV